MPSERMAPQPASVPLCSVVVRTLGSPQREAGLRRALASVADAAPGLPVETLVILNGDGCSPTFRAELCARPLRLVHLAEASAAAALVTGFAQARGRWIMFLDDDDWLLAGGLAQALEAALECPEAVLLIMNGERLENGVRSRLMVNLQRVERDPMGCFFESNWLASSSGLFCKERFPDQVFRSLPDHFEWSLIAFRCANAQIPMRVFDAPVFVIDTGTTASASKSESHIALLPDVLLQMHAEARSARARRAIGRKRAAAQHHLAARALASGHMGRAWRHHLRSLCAPGGVRYVSFTRHLLLA